MDLDEQVLLCSFGERESIMVVHSFVLVQSPRGTSDSVIINRIESVAFHAYSYYQTVKQPMPSHSIVKLI